MNDTQPEENEIAPDRSTPEAPDIPPEEIALEEAKARERSNSSGSFDQPVELDGVESTAE